MVTALHDDMTVQRRLVNRSVVVILAVTLAIAYACGGSISVDVSLPTFDLPVPGTGAVAAPPPFSQADHRWARDRLGSSTDPSHDLAWGGCYVTSLAMLFNAYLPDFTDPSRVNKALLERDGFLEHDQVIWAKAAKLAPLGMRFDFDANQALSWSKIDAELAEHRPVLIPVQGIRSHIVIIWSRESSGKATEYSVMDPQKGGAYTWTRDADTHVGDNGKYRIRGMTTFSPGE